MANNVMSEVQRLRELFRGRFSIDEARRLFEHNGTNLNQTVVFIFESDPATVRNIAITDADGFVEVRNNRRHRELAIQDTIPFEYRQYACQQCDNVWWRKVPIRKRVAKCRRCRQRYEAIPRNREWGWAEFVCHTCNHVFRGFGQMENTWSPCFACTTPTLPTHVLPRRRRTARGGRRGRDNHSCHAHNCFSKAAGITRGYCVHPRSLQRGRRAVLPSNIHASSGSTVSTFMTQDDLVSQISDFDAVLSDVDENNDDGEN